MTQPSEADLAATIPESHHDLFEKAFAHLATLMPDGSPQVNPRSGWTSTAPRGLQHRAGAGRTRTCSADGRVAIEILDPDNPYRYLQVRGKIVDITEVGADDVIDKLAKKYLDADKYPFRQPGEVRVTYKIRSRRA
ncbi:MAG: PPOX class F420-dependent oxidoreductase [Deltaproteobacteria bacterium]|nr:PPOX class F420-dependent oxidoreductase [Deltaproteobacteria bacterium]